MMSYLSLFLSAFIAATLLPMYSEVVLVALLANDKSPWLLLITATVGNTLGAMVNWILGRYLRHFEQKTWFPVKSHTLKKAENVFNRYGCWTLLFAWLPAFGDALPFIAGIMRTHPLLVCLLCAIGKGARYGVIIYLFFRVS